MNKPWWNYKESKYKELIKQKEESLQIHIKELDRLRAENKQLLKEFSLGTVSDGNFTKDELISFARYVWYEKPLFRCKPNEGLLTYFDEWEGKNKNKQLLIMTPQEKANELKQKATDTMIESGMRVSKYDVLTVATLIACEIVSYLTSINPLTIDDLSLEIDFYNKVIKILSE